MLNKLNADQDTSNTMRDLTIDELESVCGGATTLPPADGCGCGCGKRCN